MRQSLLVLEEHLQMYPFNQVAEILQRKNKNKSEQDEDEDEDDMR